MVTPFVRTRHATKWNTTAHLPTMRPIDIFSLDKAATNDTTGSDVRQQQLGPGTFGNLHPPQIYAGKKYTVK